MNLLTMISLDSKRRDEMSRVLLKKENIYINKSRLLFIINISILHLFQPFNLIGVLGFWGFGVGIKGWIRGEWLGVKD